MDSLPELALSVRQPWAWAIIYGGKDIENRSWQATNHGLTVRGRKAIHAAKGMTRDEYDDASTFIRRDMGIDCPDPAYLTRGAIIGSVDVVDVVKESESRWFFGPRGLVLRNPIPCKPIPCIGALGYFRWTEADPSVMPAPAKWMLPPAPPSPRLVAPSGPPDDYTDKLTVAMADLFSR